MKKTLFVHRLKTGGDDFGHRNPSLDRFRFRFCDIGLGCVWRSLGRSPCLDLGLGLGLGRGMMVMLGRRRERGFVGRSRRSGAGLGRGVVLRLGMLNSGGSHSRGGDGRVGCGVRRKRMEEEDGR